MTLTLEKSITYAIARSSGDAYPSGVSKLGKNIERLRLLAGHTNAAKFARLIGVTPATLNDWEGGRYSNLRLDSLLRVARGVPCSIDDLLAGVDDDYEKFRRVAHLEREKKIEPVTSPDSGPEVQQDRPGSRGSRHAPASDNRLSESQANINAQVRRDIGRIADRLALAEQLDESSAAIRFVADALRAGGDAAASSGKQPTPTQSHPSVRRTDHRRTGR